MVTQGHGYLFGRRGETIGVIWVDLTKNLTASAARKRFTNGSHATRCQMAIWALIKERCLCSLIEGNSKYFQLELDASHCHSRDRAQQ